MRTIRVIVGFKAHQAGDNVEVDDQVATDAIAQGLAVPSVDAVIKAFDPVVETRALDGAAEVK